MFARIDQNNLSKKYRKKLTKPILEPLGKGWNWGNCGAKKQNNFCK